MKRIFTLAALAIGAGSGAAQAQTGVAVGLGVGTTGGVAEVQVEVTPHIQLRGGYNYFQYDIDDRYDDIAYEGDLDLSTFGAFIDLRPFANSVIVTGGAYFGDKSLGLSALPGQTYEIGGNTYTSAEVGALAASVDLEDTAPFIGLGWDSTFQGSGKIGFKAIAGAMFTGTPEVNLTSTGGALSSDPAFLAELAEEEQSLQDDVDDYEVYPVLQLGLTLAF